MVSQYLVLPITNSVVDQVTVVTERHRDYHLEALSEAVESFERYRNESFTEDELAMLSYREIAVDLKDYK